MHFPAGLLSQQWSFRPQWLLLNLVSILASGLPSEAELFLRLSFVFPCCHEDILSPTSEQRDNEVHKQIPDLHRSPAHSFIMQGLGVMCRCAAGGQGWHFKVQIRVHCGAHHCIGPYLKTGTVKNILGRGNDPLALLYQSQPQ